MYKQKDVAKIEGVEARSVSRWTVDELASRGWFKHGKGNGCFYTREQDSVIEGVEIDRKKKIRG